jgi:hypothetical protein
MGAHDRMLGRRSFFGVAPEPACFSASSRVLVTSALEDELTPIQPVERLP